MFNMKGVSIMKRFLSVLLMLALLFSLCAVSGLAADKETDEVEEGAEEKEDKKIDYKNGGYSEVVIITPEPSPSVEREEIPELSKDCVIVLWDYADHNDLAKIIYIVPFEDILFVPAAALKDENKEAYQMLDHARSITDVCENAAEVAHILDPDADTSKLVVLDVFEFRLLGHSKEILDADRENHMRLSFRYPVKEGDFFMLLRFEEGKWVAVNPDYYEVVDGEIHMKILIDGLLAFVVMGE